MKLTLILTILVVAIATAYGLQLKERRGFRLGASDRFSHGFGKRTDPFEQE